MSLYFKNPKGSLLLEVLLAVTFFVSVASMGAQMIVVSNKSNAMAGDRDVAKGLLQEELEGIRATSDGGWNNLAGLTRGSPYHTLQSGSAWAFSAGVESLVMNGLTYSRSFTVASTSRDLSTRSIESTYNSAHDDPSTVQVVATVSWQGGETITASEYVERWRNLVCAQTSWAGGGGDGSTAHTCPATTYDQASSTLTVSSNQLQLH